MPQMSPMLWSLLFIYFTILFIFFNILNYFLFLPISQTSNSDTSLNNFKTNKTLNWKW